MTTIHHYDSQGRPCDKYGKVIRNPENVVADGQSVVVSMQFMDSAQRAIHDADITDDGQAAYEARIADAWKDIAASSPAHVTDDGQAAYEQRMNDAWKARPEDYPEAA